MSGLSSRYESLQTAKHFAEHYRKIAVIVGTTAQEETQDSAVHGAPQGGDVVAQRYRIRILGEDPPDKPENRLPVAYPLQLNSGLGAQNVGIIRYTPNTFVYVSKDPNSGTYQIEAVVPNFVRNLLEDGRNQAQGVAALSGFIPGQSTVPDTSVTTNPTINELFGTQKTSKFSDKEEKQSNTKTPTMPKACEKVNTAGINDAIDRLIQQVEELRTGLLGEDSFLQTSQDFINDAKNVNIASGIGIGGSEYEISLSSASQDIAQIIAALMQEMRKWVIRKVSTGVNLLIGQVPLSTRYIANETKDKALSALSCLFYRIFLGLEDLIAGILSDILDRILNAASCLVENILGGIIGEIIGRITGLINSVLGDIGELVGQAIDFTSQLINFVSDIIDLIRCPVENICPSTDSWDFLSGSKSGMAPLDFDSVFNQAKSVAASAANTVGNVTATFDDLLDDWNFYNEDGSVFEPLGDINAGTIWQSVLDGSCNTDAIDCGPPKVNFFGGNGSGGAGNAVINAAGEILGVQMLLPGNYTSAPSIEFEDACGNGKGGTGTVIIGPVDDGDDDLYDDGDDDLYDDGDDDLYDDDGDDDDDNDDLSDDGDDDLDDNDNDGIDDKLGVGLVKFDLERSARIKTAPIRVTFQLLGNVPNSSGDSFFEFTIDQAPTSITKNIFVNRDYLVTATTITPVEGRLSRRQESGDYDPSDLDNINVRITRGLQNENAEFGDYSRGFSLASRKFGSTLPGLRTGNGIWVDYKDTVEGIPKRLGGTPLGSAGPRDFQVYPSRGVYIERNSISDNVVVYRFRKRDKDKTDVNPSTGIVDVVIDDPGYGYEGYPYGDKGGGGRVWANRCQTSVHRSNYNWDSPYSLGQTVRVYYGDEITLPGQETIVIDADFTEDKIPGCIINGVNPKLKDMQNFDYTFGRKYEFGIRHQFGFEVDAQRAFAEGFTEQDIRFFLENKFFLRVGGKMREKLLDPNWGKIPEFSVTFTAPGCPPGTPEDPNLPPRTPEDPNLPPGAPGGGGDDGDEVISTIGLIFIDDPGFGYDDGDTLLIGDGTNGSGDLIINNGQIIGVNITNPGIGFTSLPSMTINTETGYNAVLKPVLRFINPNDSGFVVPLGTPTLQVIDCVGKV
jgi:hypothetical protein